MQKYEFTTKISPAGTIVIPKSLLQIVSHRVKIIMIDLNDQKAVKRISIKGALHQYSDPAKIPDEKTAIRLVFKRKHEAT